MNIRRIFLGVSSTCLFLCLAIRGSAGSIYRSDWDDGTAQGWVLGNDSRGVYSLVGGGGMPGGFIRFTDSESPASFNAGIIAPAGFLGNYTEMGSDLRFEFDVRTERAQGHEPEIILSGPGGEARYIPRSGAVTRQWQHFVVPLRASAWRVDRGTWDLLLRNVTSVLVSLDIVGFSAGEDQTLDGNLDNFAICAAPDLLATDLVWDVEQGGVKFRVKSMVPLPLEVPFVLYWADRNGEKLGDNVMYATLPKNFVGEFPGDPWRRFTNERLWVADPRATQLVLSIDPANLLKELNRENNRKALDDVVVEFLPELVKRKRNHISDVTRTSIKEALREVGQSHVYVTSTVRSVQEDVDTFYSDIFNHKNEWKTGTLAAVLVTYGREQLAPILGINLLDKKMQTAEVWISKKKAALDDGNKRVVIQEALDRVYTTMLNMAKDAVANGRRTSRHQTPDTNTETVDIDRMEFPIGRAKEFLCSLYLGKKSKHIRYVGSPIPRTVCEDWQDSSIHIEVDITNAPVPQNEFVLSSGRFFTSLTNQAPPPPSPPGRLETINGFAQVVSDWNGTPIHLPFKGHKGDVIRAYVRSWITSPDGSVPDPTLEVKSDDGTRLAVDDDSDDDVRDPLIQSLELPKDGGYELVVDGWPLDPALASLITPAPFGFILSIGLTPSQPTIWLYRTGKTVALLEFPAAGSALFSAPTVHGPWSLVTNAVPTELAVGISNANLFYKLTP